MVAGVLITVLAKCCNPLLAVPMAGAVFSCIQLTTLEASSYRYANRIASNRLYYGYSYYRILQEVILLYNGWWRRGLLTTPNMRSRHPTSNPHTQDKSTELRRVTKTQNSRYRTWSPHAGPTQQPNAERLIDICFPAHDLLPPDCSRPAMSP